MMDYQGNIYRPPSEANSILLQVTIGCSHNKCTFCGMYKEKRFSIKNHDIVMADIDFAATHCRRQKRVFLCDGDALSLPHRKLLEILQAIQVKLSWVTRVGIYANASTIERKSREQIQELRECGLGIVYMGLESGDDQTLKRIHKGATSTLMINAGRKIKAAGIKLSLTVLLGIGGKDRSHIHALKTGQVLTSIDPEYVGALSLMVTSNTTIYDEIQKGCFALISAEEMLEELAIMLANTTLSDGYFHGNHASNYLPIKAKLPQDKASTLEMINKALKGKISLKPEYMRGL